MLKSAISSFSFSMPCQGPSGTLASLRLLGIGTPGSIFNKVFFFLALKRRPSIHCVSKSKSDLRIQHGRVITLSKMFFHHENRNVVKHLAHQCFPSINHF